MKSQCCKGKKWTFLDIRKIYEIYEVHQNQKTVILTDSVALLSCIFIYIDLFPALGKITTQIILCNHNLIGANLLTKPICLCLDITKVLYLPLYSLVGAIVTWSFEVLQVNRDKFLFITFQTKF